MAEQKDQTDEELDLDVKGGSNKTMIVLIVLAVLLLLVGGVGGYVLLTNGEEEEKKEKNQADEATAPDVKPALYFAIKPEFTVNFADSSKARFLQLSITLMARDDRAFAMVEKHMPIVRDDIINMLAEKSFEQLNSAEGKQKLANEILASVQRVIEEEIKHTEIVLPGIEAVYFTSFVMQ